MNLLFSTLSVFVLFSFTSCVISADPGEPLFLSNYLTNPTEAKKLSLVELGSFYSYSGYFTVNSTYGSNIFFWFFPAQSPDSSSAPVLMWLQGGPGVSSMFGLFSENGPFRVSPDGTRLVDQPFNWNRKYSMLYVDNPVGAGFSFTQSDLGFSRNEVDVGDNLYSFLTQFFQIFSEYQKNDFYVTGESYAGKYVPAIAYKIFQENQKTLKINLKGISIGDGMVDPLTQTQGLGDLAYYMSLADENERRVIQRYESQIKTNILAGDYVTAFRYFDELINGDFVGPTYFRNITGTDNYYNFLDPNYPPNPYPQFLDLSTTRLSIHVGSVPYFDYNKTAEFYLISDWMFSVKPWLEVLLDNVKVLIYNGQNDIILSAPIAESFLRTVQWSGAAEYRVAEKTIWKVRPNDDSVAGYVRSVKNFRQVVVKDAGHLLPLDQPERAFDMIDRFIQGTPF